MNTRTLSIRSISIAMVAISALLILAGCSAKSAITPQYINPSNYSHHSCDTLAQEIQRIKTLTASHEKQSATLAATGVGIGITGTRHGIYPTISFGVGKSHDNSQKQHTLSRLYGEHDAMVMAARQKNCPFAHSLKIYGE